MKKQASTSSARNRSSLSAFRNGLTGQVMVMPAEDIVAYQHFTKGFFEDLKPVGIVEKLFVQTIADTSWRLNRIPALENKILVVGFAKYSEHNHAVRSAARAALSALSAYGERLSLQFEGALKQLGKLQSKRRHSAEGEDLTGDGFVFPSTDVEQVM